MRAISHADFWIMVLNFCALVLCDIAKPSEFLFFRRMSGVPGVMSWVI